MKYLIAAILVGGLGWYYLVDGSKLDEAMVRQFYEQQSVHTYERDPDALCRLFGRNFSLKKELHIGGRVVTGLVREG